MITAVCNAEENNGVTPRLHMMPSRAAAGNRDWTVFFSSMICLKQLRFVYWWICYSVPVAASSTDARQISHLFPYLREDKYTHQVQESDLLSQPDQ